jgi:hypothetical protein
MIYMALNVMLLMRANPLRGQVGGGLVPGNRDFFGPCEMASSWQGSANLGPPTCPRDGFARIKTTTR